MNTPLINAAEKMNAAAERHAFYNTCTREELESFVKSRTGKSVTALSHIRLREWLIKLDDCFIFRFLDLPAELRLLIEEELLATPEKLHSQILSTCKEVYNEASPLLQKRIDSDIHLVRFRSNETDMLESHRDKRCSCHTTRDYTTIQFRSHDAQPLGPTDLIHRELSAMSPIVDGATHLVIDIAFHQTCAGRPKAKLSLKPNKLINRQLYLLASQSPHSNINKVSLRVTTREEIFIEKAIFEMLWPLTKLGPDVGLFLSGNGVSNGIITTMNTEQARHSYSRTSLSIVPAMMATAQDLGERVHKAGLTNTGVQFLPQLLNATLARKENIQPGLRFFNDIGQEDPRCDCEGEITHSVNQMGQILSSDKWTDLKQQADQILQSKAESDFIDPIE